MKRLFLVLTFFASACQPAIPVHPIQPAPAPFAEALTVRGPDGNLPTGVAATFVPDDGSGLVQGVVNNGRIQFLFNSNVELGWGGNLTVSAPNMVLWQGRANTNLNGELCPCQQNGGLYENEVLLVASWPQPVARAPLTFEGNDGSLVCHTDLPAGLVIPSTPSLTFWRGDAWGVTVPGLPFVNGGSSVHPERVLTWFFDRWSPDWQKQILDAYRQRGYTHFALSWPDSRSGNGQSVSQFVATAQTVKAAIPYVAVFLTSKVYDPANADAPTRMAAVTPVLDALVQAHAVDIVVVGWELDLFNDGQDLENFIDALSQRYPTLPLYVHFTTYKTSWQPDGQPRAQFWQHMAAFRASVGATGQIGLLYQGNPTDSCGLQQAHFNDAQVEASGIADNGGIVIPWELVAEQQFDGPADETFGVTRGRELLATPGPLLASGGGNGLFNADGSPTLSSYPSQP